MSVESGLITAVKHTAEGAATSVAGSLVGAAASASNPISAFGTALKVGTYVAGAALMGFMIWKLWSFVEMAAEDHAVRASQAAQIITDAKTNKDNLKAAADDLAQRDAVISKLNVVQADERLRAAALQTKLETMSHAKPSTGCKPSAAVTDLLNGLR